MTSEPRVFESPEKVTAYLREFALVRGIAPVHPMGWQGFLNVESALLAGGRLTALVRRGAANASVWAVLLVPSEKSWARGQVTQEDGQAVGIVQTLLDRLLVISGRAWPPGFSWMGMSRAAPFVGGQGKPSPF